MEKVSAKEFFTIMWRGVCQVLGWFLGLFGYKRDDKFAKCIWGLFATSAAVIMAVCAFALVCGIWYELNDNYFRRYRCCGDERCYAIEYVSATLRFHNHFDGKGYIFNAETKQKLLKDVKWIALPVGKDSLVCYSNGKKRGYFNKKTGEVVVEPKYDHAWIFSEGVASVDEGGYIKFIDGTGKVVIDKQMAYIPNMEGYVFHGGYCVVDTDDGEQCGLMDMTGKIVLPLEYSKIDPTNDFKLWRVRKGNEMAVFDKELNPIIPFMECSIYIDEGTIDVTMADHTMRKYDYSGILIHDFYITSIRTLEYEKDEILYRTRTHDDDGDEYAVPFVESYHPQATARLRAYVAGDGYEGLMTADGHVVMMPLYRDIEALDHDLYLCTSTNYDKVVVNGKGEVVR